MSFHSCRWGPARIGRGAYWAAAEALKRVLGRGFVLPVRRSSWDTAARRWHQHCISLFSKADPLLHQTGLTLNILFCLLWVCGGEKFYHRKLPFKKGRVRDSPCLLMIFLICSSRYSRRLIRASDQRSRTQLRSSSWNDTEIRTSGFWRGEAQQLHFTA